MKKQPQYYTEEEKQIFINHFVLKKGNCKADFNQYLEKFLNEYAVLLPEELRKNNKHFGNAKTSHITDFEYDSKDIMWDSKDNIVTAILAHEKFEPTNTRMKDINKLKPNWSFVNTEGNNALHFMAEKGEFTYLDDLINNHQLDTNVKNNNGDYFTYMILNNVHIISNSSRDDWQLTKALTWLEDTMTYYEHFPHHFDDISFDKIVKIKADVEKQKLNVEGFMFKNYKLVSKNYKEAFSDVSNKLDSFLSYYYLKLTALEKPESNVKKSKI